MTSFLAAEDARPVDTTDREELGGGSCDGLDWTGGSPDSLEFIGGSAVFSRSSTASRNRKKIIHPANETS